MLVYFREWAPHKTNYSELIMDNCEQKLEEIERELSCLKQGLQDSVKEIKLIIARKVTEKERWMKLASLLLENRSSCPLFAKSVSYEKPAATSSSIVAAQLSDTPDVLGYERGAIFPESTTSVLLECGQVDIAISSSSSKMDRIRQATVRREEKIRSLLDGMKSKLNQDQNHS